MILPDSDKLVVGGIYKPECSISGGYTPDSQWIELSDAYTAEIVDGNSVKFNKTGVLTITLHVYVNGKEYKPSVTVSVREKNTDPPVQIVPGDVDMDGKISAYDAALVLAEYAETSSGASSSLNGMQKAAADIDGDGKITAGDAGEILTIYANSQS